MCCLLVSAKNLYCTDNFGVRRGSLSDSKPLFAVPSVGIYLDVLPIYHNYVDCLLITPIRYCKRIHSMARNNIVSFYSFTGKCLFTAGIISFLFTRIKWVLVTACNVLSLILQMENCLPSRVAL
jgi:hypothetical protein